MDLMSCYLIIGDISEVVEETLLAWFGHVKRMEDNRWPRKELEWVPPGWPHWSWGDGVAEAMRAKILNEEN